jgi:hypothetical protein
LAALLKDGDRYYAAYLPMGGQMTEVTMWRQPDRNYYTLERSDPLVFTNPSGNRTLITGYFINIGRDPAEDGVVETRGRIELAGSDTRISFWIDKNGQVNFGADERAKLPQLEGRNVVLPLGGQYQSVQVSRVTQNANEIDISFAEPVQVNVGSGLIAVSGLRIDKAGDYAGVSAYMASGTLESNRVGLAGFFANMHGFDASRATRTTASDTMIFRITNKGIQLIGGTTIRVEGVNMNGVTGGSFYEIGSVLGPNGKVYGIPYSNAGPAQLMELDPVTGSTVLFGPSFPAFSFTSGVLAPNGMIYTVPYTNTAIYEIDPTKRTATAVTGVLVGGYSNGSLAPNGKIYMFPYDAPNTNVLEFDPNTKQMTSIGNNFAGGLANKYEDGVMAPNGKIYTIPRDATNVAEISTGSVGTFCTGLLTSSYLNHY